MPSPFPGMDPYIESEGWSDFHGAMIFAIRGMLSSRIRSGYVVRAEDRVYLERQDAESMQFVADVAVSKGRPRRGAAQRSGSSVGVIEPDFLDVLVPAQVTEHYLVIRDRKQREVVTVIEVLSPANKKPGSAGHEEYYRKREELLARYVNLVEIDLLRAGERPLTVQPLRDSTDYCALIHRQNRRGKAEVYQWTLRHRLPEIPIPLGSRDPEVSLDLQKAFEQAYDTGSYELDLDYDAPLKPPARKSDVAWIRQTVAAKTNRN